MNNIIVRHSANIYPAVCNLLIKNYGFRDLHTVEADTSTKGKLSLLLELFQDCLFLLRNFSNIRNTNIIFSVGYVSIPLKILVKIRLIKCNSLLWFGFFLHSPKWFIMFGLILKLLRIEHEKFILFSECEAELYRDKLKIDRSRFRYLPCGIFEKSNDLPPSISESKDYYFSGGYSNRDFRSLIEVFTKLDKKLVIVGSSLNSDLGRLDGLPSNIIVKKDISGDEFEKYVRYSRACILIMKFNTGAAGQSVLLRYMRNKKAIIASDTDIIREYIDHGQSGLLVRNPLTELPDIISQLENSPAKIAELGAWARKKYEDKFSYRAVTSRLFEIIDEEISRIDGRMRMAHEHSKR